MLGVIFLGVFLLCCCCFVVVVAAVFPALLVGLLFLEGCGC